MGAIEVITSAQRDVWIEIRNGTKHKFHKKVWNTTMANLTLMALGSSAPEILLSVIEILGSDFFAGELGPSTIVGSAAFNLLVITGVCVGAIPPPDTKKIVCTDVFCITASASVFAYIWLLIILSVVTPHRVDSWEAILTFMMFPALCVVAYFADKGKLGYLFRCGGGMSSSNRFTADALAEETNKLQDRFGKELPERAISFLLQEQRNIEMPTANSKAAIRKNSMVGITGGKKNAAATIGDMSKELTYGWELKNHYCLECAGTIRLKVVASRPSACAVQMHYCTQEGTAKAGVRFNHAEGIVRFQPNQVERYVDIPVIDDSTWQDDEHFSVMLTNFEVLSGVTISARGRAMSPGHYGLPSPGRGLGGEVEVPRLDIDTTVVTVLNDDMPGTIVFDSDETYTTEGNTVSLGVARTHGSVGRITVNYKTIDGSACSGRDFQAVEGTLTFEGGELNKTIEVRILVSDHHATEGCERFQVELSDGSQGVKFAETPDGPADKALCDVFILGSGSASLWTRMVRICWNEDQFRAFLSEWQAQFSCAMYCSGSPEEQAQAGWQDWLFHIISLTWKLLFACVPPPSLCGGWACFCGALGAIGCVTAVVGDMATLLGCCLTIPNDITAITLVALGTSLPDTFASKTAAQQDDCADNSVGNVTGSNSVNVFLGLGMPWTLAAFHWESIGATQDWKEHMYKGSTYESLYIGQYASGGFIMPAGSLSFSVTVFTVCSLLCFVLLAWRRKQYGGELGGPSFAQKRDSMIMFSLWLVYIVASIIQSLSSQ